MKWQEDLVKDIRFNNKYDDSDKVKKGTLKGLPWAPVKVPYSVSACNMLHLTQQFNKIKEDCKFILEIGVTSTVNFVSSSTRVFKENKKQETFYLGLDIDDRSYLLDPSNNFYTQAERAENYSVVEEFMNKHNLDRIDFLFIDGWHSINQVLLEWEYTKYLSDFGIVGLHDTAYHPGPYFFLRNLDSTRWNIIHNACEDNINDYGIGFAWKKQIGN